VRPDKVPASTKYMKIDHEASAETREQIRLSRCLWLRSGAVRVSPSWMSIRWTAEFCKRPSTCMGGHRSSASAAHQPLPKRRLPKGCAEMSTNKILTLPPFFSPSQATTK
jgi:hypothetical protein